MAASNAISNLLGTAFAPLGTAAFWTSIGIAAAIADALFRGSDSFASGLVQGVGDAVTGTLTGQDAEAQADTRANALRESFEAGDIELLANQIRDLPNITEAIAQLRPEEVMQFSEALRDFDDQGLFSRLFVSLENAADRLEELAGAGTFQTGGLVRGPGTGTSDSILARISNGEYIVRASAVRQLGTGFLDSINQGIIPQFQAGGLVGRAQDLSLDTNQQAIFQNLINALTCLLYTSPSPRD